MEILARALAGLVPVAWTAAAAAYLLVFLRRDEAADRWCRRLACAAAAVHALLFVAVAASGRPLFRSAGMVLFGVGLAIMVVHLYLESRIRSRTIGIFPVSLTVLAALVGVTLGIPEAVPVEFPKWSTPVHVGGAVLAYSGVLLAALYGSLYLVQRGALRQHRFGLFWERLPALELLDQFSSRSLLAAFLCLTLTIAFGHVVGREPGLAFRYYDPKVMVTNLIWLGALLLLVSRRFRWMRPRTSAIGCVVMFAFVLLNMFVVDAFSDVHPRY